MKFPIAFISGIRHKGFYNGWNKQHIVLPLKENYRECQQEFPTLLGVLLRKTIQEARIQTGDTLGFVV